LSYSDEFVKYETPREKLIKYLRNLLGLLGKEMETRLEEVEGLGLENAMRLVAGTRGFGLIGKRAKIPLKALQAYLELEELYEELGLDEADEETQKVFGAEINSVRTELFARAHTDEMLPSDEARAIADLLAFDVEDIRGDRKRKKQRGDGREAGG